MKLHRNSEYVKWGLTAFLVIVTGGLFWLIFSNLTGFYDALLSLFDILSPILYGCLFAYLMNPIMERTRVLLEKFLTTRKRQLQEKTVRRVSFIGGLVTAVLVFLMLIYALIAMIVPNVIDSIESLLQKDRLESYYNTISDWINRTFTGTPVETWFHDNLNDLLTFITDKLREIDLGSFVVDLTSSVYSVVMGVFSFLLGIIAAVYILVFKKELCWQSKKIVVAWFRPERANRLFELARRTNRIFGGYVIGKLIDALIVGVITYIFMLIANLPYAALVSALVGVTNVIPFFGPLIGMVPSALLLLLDKPVNALIFIIFSLILQQIDGNIIENRILGEKLGISDFWVLVAILLFGGVFGIVGMLLGVPVFVVIYSLIADHINRRLRSKHLPTEGELYYTLQCVEELPREPETSETHAAPAPNYDTNAVDAERAGSDDDK